MRIRAYTLDVHAGHAPCWMHDKSGGCEVLTLANCKPRIRDVALVSEWIAVVTPKRMGHRLAHLMRVGESITRFQYWGRYKDSRLDSIYRPKKDGEWRQLRNPWHSDEESYARDLSSEWVLSTDFYMFANSYSDDETTPQGLKLPERYSALARGGMRGYGQFIELPNSFSSWMQKQTRLKLSEFRVLREFGVDGCGHREGKVSSCPVSC